MLGTTLQTPIILSKSCETLSKKAFHC